MIIRREKYADCIADIKPLLVDHWRELALYQDTIPLDPDFDAYANLDATGFLHIFCVRTDDGELIGYAAYLMHRHLHYKGHKFALADLFWLKPEFRRAGIGIRMFEFIENALRELGADVMHTTFKTDFPAAGHVLEALGHRCVEHGYSKELSHGHHPDDSGPR